MEPAGHGGGEEVRFMTGRCGTLRKSGRGRRRVPAGMSTGGGRTGTMRCPGGVGDDRLEVWGR
ncbi:MAG: hypothetical protein ACYYK0_03620 [Candidatus Eutrophobiaceae bacterium]